MATLRNLISTCRGEHKLLSTDGLVTDRLIAAEIKNTADDTFEVFVNGKLIKTSKLYADAIEEAIKHYNLSL